MQRLLLPLVLGLLAANLGASTVDLTPRYLETEVDGHKSRRLYFLEEKRKIGLSLDQETVVAVEAAGVIFRFPKLPDTSFKIATSPLTPEDAMSEAEVLKRYRAAALAFVPVGATEAKVVEEVTDPLPINHWESHRFLVSYQAGAIVMRLGVTFLNVNPKSQLVLITSASPRAFSEAADRSFQIIRSWHEILPGDIATTRGN